MHRSFSLLLVLAWVTPVYGQPASSMGNNPPLLEGQALVDRALANEYKAAQDLSHPMCYQLRKTSPRLTTTKAICETKDGEVARLIAINDKPLSVADAQREDARLNALASDSRRQRRRKQAEDEDAGRVLKVLRALPTAFVYQDAGPGEDPTGKNPGNVEKFTFKPNPSFSPPDLETQVLTAMAGEIWIDAARQRVVRLGGHLQHDVDFGWGILGRLNKGGWIVIEQADIGDGQWRIMRFQMAMSGRVVLKSRVFDTTEEETHFAPVPVGLSYQKAIAMLRADPK